MVLQGVSTAEAATTGAEKLRDVTSQRISLPDGSEITPTLRIGVTMLRLGESTDELDARADNARYLSKKARATASSRSADPRFSS